MYKGKVSDCMRGPRQGARLRVIRTVAWMWGAFPPSEPMPAELKKVTFITGETEEAQIHEHTLQGKDCRVKGKRYGKKSKQRYAPHWLLPIAANSLSPGQGRRTMCDWRSKSQL